MLAGISISERRKLLAGNVRNAAHVNTKDVFGEHETTDDGRRRRGRQMDSEA